MTNTSSREIESSAGLKEADNKGAEKQFSQVPRQWQEKAWA